MFACAVGLGLWGGGEDIAVPSDKESADRDRRILSIFPSAVDLAIPIFPRFVFSAREL